MASVILPTREYGPVARDLAAQLREEDELLIVCDSESDPVAVRARAGDSRAGKSRARDAETGDPGDGDAIPEDVEVVVAGDPVGCSGKANAVAAGLERATCERIVWTDDDFDHPGDWLRTLQREGERRGPVSEVPLFVAESRWWIPFEPIYVVFGSTVVADAGKPWAGGCTFTRSELVGTVEDLVTDLRRSVSDDGTLSEHLDQVTPLRDRARTVGIDDSPREVYHRLVRFVRISYLQEPANTVAGAVAFTVLALLAVLYPFVLAPLVTLATRAYYRRFDLDRPSWVLAFPALLLIPVQFAVGMAATEFEWGGRRYRWTGQYEVEVVERNRDESGSQERPAADD